jgi:oxalate decarboxylase
VIGDEDIHFLIFFDQPFPADVGYRASATALSKEVLAATFGVKAQDMPQFPFTSKDSLIVARKYPLDPVKTSKL